MSENTPHERIEEHKSLFQEITELVNKIDVNPTSSLSIVQEIRALIKEHFEVEEEGGYMQIVLDQNPNLDGVINDLGSQHARLLEGVDSLLATLSPTAPMSHTQASHFQDWIKTLREHEAAENTLLLEELNRDLGATD